MTTPAAGLEWQILESANAFRREDHTGLIEAAARRIPRRHACRSPVAGARQAPGLRASSTVFTSALASASVGASAASRITGSLVAGLARSHRSGQSTGQQPVGPQPRVRPSVVLGEFLSGPGHPPSLVGPTSPAVSSA